jgi:2-methylisocitrate lyase-like PEP mutase family enzyme
MPTTEILAQRQARNAAFRALHSDGCFVIPNPWDVGSARWLRAKGFKALATTSAGLAWRQGRADQQVPLDMMLAYLREMVHAVPDTPVNADFENGYADDEATLAHNVKLCVATGVAGLSIEDATGRPAEPLYDFDTALRRFKIARQAVNDTGENVMLTARAEAYLHGHATPLPEVCKRLAAFADAGADVLYAPGAKTPTDIREIVAAAGGKPVNLVVFNDFGLTVDDIAKLGVRRISIGSALAKTAWTGFTQAVDGLLAGNFSAFGKSMPSAVLNGFFEGDAQSLDVAK